jgi:hypothetical protein
MAEIVTVKLVAETGDAVKNVEKVEKSVQKTGIASKKASKELSGLEQAGGAVIGKLDRVTGGLASKFVAVGKAAKLSGKAMKTALISSGIGLAVVALSLIVEYWDDISEALGFVNNDLEKQVELNKRNLELTSDQLSNLDLRIKLGKKQGKNVDDLIAKRKILVGIQKQQILDSIANLKLQKQELEVDAKKLTIWERISQAFVKTKDQASEITEEEKEAIRLKEKEITDLENRLLNIEISELPDAVKDTSEEDAKKAANEATKIAEAAEKARLEAIERIRKGLIDTEAEERAEKLRLIKEDYDEQIALAAEFYGTNSIKILELKAAQKLAEDEQQAVFDEQDKARQDKLDEEEKNRKEKQLADDKKISDAAIKIAELEEEAKRTSLEGYAGAINSLSNTIGQETAAGKGLAVASSLINTYAAITGQLKTAASSPGGAIPGYAIAQAIATGVAGFAAVKKIVAVQVPGGGGSGSSQTGSLPTAPTPPSFNVVGASGETQLADAIGSQTQRPARAYVVSNDVTTAQEMDRNIIEGASI